MLYDCGTGYYDGELDNFTDMISCISDFPFT